ncbi:ribose-phosphate pyrophosphokinase [Candidatus Micrarchaeota archaeon]|nr:ribose-phosphate pyrophosphokinase [Candidatus Micrarchaeota archaeon]
MAREVVVVVGSAHPENIGVQVVGELKKLGVPASRGLFEEKTFADGEKYVRLEKASGLANKDFFIIQSVHTPSKPGEKHFLQLLHLISAAKANGAHSVHVVMPYYAYGRQERVSKPGEAEVAQTIFNAIKGAGADSVSAVDVHAPHAMPAGLKNVMPTDLWLKELAKMGFKPEDTVVFAGDKGALPRVNALADKSGASIAKADKIRPEHDKCFLVGFSGDVNKRFVLSLDDILSTGGTFGHSAKELKRRGARKVYGFITHLVGVGKAWSRLEKAKVDAVFVTDSLPLEGRKLSSWDKRRVERLLKSRKLRIVPIAPLLAKTIAERAKGK